MNILFHTDGPENIRLSPSQVSYETNETTNVGPIQCEADCKPSCSFNWTKGGNSVSNTRTLQMSYVTSIDTGLYVCTARHNRGYNMTKDVTVNVICK